MITTKNNVTYLMKDGLVSEVKESDTVLQFVLITSMRSYWTLSLHVDTEYGKFETMTRISDTHILLEWRIKRAIKRLTKQWKAIEASRSKLLRIASI